MTTGQAPFILVQEGEILLFRSLDALARYVEAPDLAGARAYDSEGRAVLLSSPPVKKRFGVVSVPPVTASVTDHQQHDELREVLRNYVVDRASLPEDALSDNSLAELVRRALSIASYMP